MEKFILEQDIEICYVAARSFPDGIEAAHQQLHALLPSTAGRQFYGISFPGPDGQISYKAGVAKIYDGEAGALGCPTFLLKKGTYISVVLHNYQDDIQQVGAVFQQLIAMPGISPHGECVEQYLGENDMRCMVRLAEGF